MSKQIIPKIRFSEFDGEWKMKLFTDILIRKTVSSDSTKLPKLELEDIDTSTSEENFSKLLNEKKTYFLNGSWGSGKTTFLKNVDEKYDEKLVFIDLW